MVRGRAALVAAALFVPAAAMATPVQFTVADDLSAGQVQEDIAVFFGGRLAGMLHIDRDHPHDEFNVTAHLAETYDFALCGRLLREDGNPREHPIDDAGTLTDVDGRRFTAMTIDDRVFTLRDITTGRPVVEVKVRPGPACAPTVASR